MGALARSVAHKALFAALLSLFAAPPPSARASNPGGRVDCLQKALGDFLGRGKQEQIPLSALSEKLKNRYAKMLIPERYEDELTDLLIRHVPEGDLLEWMHTGAYRINSYLRDGARSRHYEYVRKHELGLIRRFDRLIESAPPAPRDFVVFRGVALDKKTHSVPKPGDLLHWKSFSSTTLDADSIGFMKMRTEDKGLHRILFIIRIPGGKKAGFSLGTLYKSAREREFVIKRDATFKVQQVTKLDSVVDPRDVSLVDDPRFTAKQRVHIVEISFLE